MNTYGDLLLLQDLAVLLDSIASSEYNQYAGSEGWVEETLLALDYNFRKEFRMDRPTFLQLVERVRAVEAAEQSGKSVKGRKSKHPLASRVGLTIRYLAGAQYWDLARIYGCAPGYVHELVAAMLPRLAKAYPLESIYKRDVRLKAERTWADTTAGPYLRGIFMAVDGYFLEHGPPAEGSMAYKTYKKTYATNIQAGADNDGRIVWYSMKAAGATHDALALAVTDLVALMRFEPTLRSDLDTDGHFIIGDDAYAGVSDYVLTPYKGSSLAQDKDAYNYYHSNARVCVERAFGMLETRWRILGRPIASRKPERWREIWQACVALHNLCTDKAVGRRTDGRVRRFPHGPGERSAAAKRAAATKRLAQAGLVRPPHPQ